jgi:NADH-quinone oxidoreductase subunit N
LALQHGYTGLVIVAVITSLIGVYYYFSIIIAMFFKEPDSISVEIGFSHKALLVILIALSLVLGILPDLIRVI